MLRGEAKLDFSYYEITKARNSVIKGGEKMKILTLKNFLTSTKETEAKYLLTEAMDVQESIVFMLQVPSFGSLSVIKPFGTSKSPKIIGTKNLKNVMQFRIFMAATGVTWAGFFIQLFDACGKNVIGDDDRGLAFLSDSHGADEVRGMLHFITCWQSGFSAVGIAEMEVGQGDKIAGSCLLLLLPSADCIKQIVKTTNYLCKKVGDPQNLLMEAEKDEEKYVATEYAATEGDEGTLNKERH